MGSVFESIADYAEVKVLHELPVFVEREFMLENLIPTIMAIAGGISIVFYLTCKILDRTVKSGDRSTRDRVAYQITNLLVNLSLGILGTFLDIFVVRPDPTVADMLVGYPELSIMACSQLGYNLWALPVGYFLVGESASMMVHHIMVIFVAFQSAFCRSGYRYFLPFMFGTMELSSVPLAVMNYAKERPALQTTYPRQFLAIRLVFAASFILIRIILLLPRQYIYLRLHVFAIESSRSNTFRAINSIVWASSFFLTLLQLWWGYLILRGLCKAFWKAVMQRRKGGITKENCKQKES